MVGSSVLRHCLQSNEIEKVISFVRRPSGISHPKLNEIIHNDFLNYKGLEKYFRNQDIAYFCIGVYTGQVPDKEFKEITYDFAVAFADVLKSQSPNATFCFLSGGGADPREKSMFSFARYKGMAENYLIKKEFKSLHVFRPKYIYPVEKRKEPNFSYRLMRGSYPLIKIFGVKYSIKSTQLGEAMYKAGIHGAAKTILENKDILTI